MEIDTQTIMDSKIKGSRFFIPRYQRGYRWTKHEVTALLNDIYEFSPGEKKQNCYCIQPLIVKPRDDGTLEVVDGQQRLTTIYIFMQIRSQEVNPAPPPFEMEYETRPGSKRFLESIADGSCLDKERWENIDFHHMASAYREMDKWLNGKPNIDKSDMITELRGKIRKNVVFIWYEIPPKTSNSAVIDMFTRVNMGKIPLTNAELIKALLLSKDNYSDDANKRQIEISVAWDRIEQGLQEDSFWYFLNEKKPSGTHIDLLFGLLANEYNSKLPEPINKNDNQVLFSFLVFSAILDIAREPKEKLERFVKGLFGEDLWKRIENECGKPGKDELEKIAKTMFVETLWEKVEELYAELRDWYDDLDNYHIIGFLIASDVAIGGKNGIFELTRGKRKSAVREALLGRAAGLVKDYDLPKLTYGEGNDNMKIRRLLLLFNIATLVCKKEKENRFPFDIYKKKNWHIEHIHARADKTDENNKPDDSLGNLTLLDVKTNLTYKNKPFDEKRKILLKRESEGLFVPLCTKNVFLKAYSTDPGDMNKWTGTDEDEGHDREDYVTAMVQMFKLVFGREVVKNDKNAV